MHFRFFLLVCGFLSRRDGVLVERAAFKRRMVPDKTNTQGKQNRHKSDNGETNYAPSSHHSGVKLFVLANFMVQCLPYFNGT
jgi:hypothetical protein